MSSRQYVFFVEAMNNTWAIESLKKATELGFYPILLARDLSWYPDVEASSYSTVICETNQVEEVKEVIMMTLHHSIGSLCGITTTSEFYIEIVALLANYFGLYSNSSDTIRTCRNKILTRQTLTNAGLLQPRFCILRSTDDIEKAVEYIKLPCIIKPSDGASSRGVRLCNSIEEIQAHLINLQNQAVNERGQRVNKDILCEEYIDAPEFSVETITWDGKVKHIGITQKMLTGFPYFVECGHVFTASISDEQRILIEQAAEKALKVVKSSYGPTHTEVKLISGGCVIIEINARLGGGMITELVYQAKGIDLLRNQILVACGKFPELSSTSNAYAGIYFFTAPRTGRLTSISNLSCLNGEEMVQMKIKVSKEAQVYLPQSSDDRLGYVIYRSKSYEAILQRLKKAQEIVDISVIDF